MSMRLASRSRPWLSVSPVLDSGETWTHSRPAGRLCRGDGLHAAKPARNPCDAAALLGWGTVGASVSSVRVAGELWGGGQGDHEGLCGCRRCGGGRPGAVGAAGTPRSSNTSVGPSVGGSRRNTRTIRAIIWGSPSTVAGGCHPVLTFGIKKLKMQEVLEVSRRWSVGVICGWGSQSSSRLL